MMNVFPRELMDKAKECKSVEALLTLAKENAIELTEAAAKVIFERLNSTGTELSDSQLEAVSSGADSKNCVCPFCGASGRYIVTAPTLNKPMGNIIGVRPIKPVRLLCTKCNTVFNP